MKNFFQHKYTRGDVYPPWLSFLDDVIRFHTDDFELNDDDDVVARVVGMIILNAAKRAAVQCVYSHDENGRALNVTSLHSLTHDFLQGIGDQVAARMIELLSSWRFRSREP